MKHSLKDWVVATRYWALPVSTMPVVATFAYLFSRNLLPAGPMPYVCFVLSLVGVILLHSAGNVLSDYYDYKSGVDNENAFAVPNLVFHHFEPEEYKRFSLLLFAAGILVGLGITLLSGPGLLIVGGIGVLLTALYSFLKFRALGDLDIFIIFGVLTVLGAGYAMTGRFQPDALILSVPLGIITVSVLHANNTYDIPSDGAAGIKTFAMLLGGKVSSILYCCYMATPFLFVILAVLFSALHPLALLCLPAAIPAWKNLRQAATYDKNGLEAMRGLDQATAKLHLAFSGLLSLGLLIAGLL